MYKSKWVKPCCRSLIHMFYVNRIRWIQISYWKHVRRFHFFPLKNWSFINFQKPFGNNHLIKKYIFLSNLFVFLCMHPPRRNIKSLTSVVPRPFQGDMHHFTVFYSYPCIMTNISVYDIFCEFLFINGPGIVRQTANRKTTSRSSTKSMSLSFYPWTRI